MAILLWTALPSHGNAGPQAQCSHGKAQTTSPSGSITWQWPFSCNVFLIRLPPSMRETIGAGAHGTAAAMVKADALWDARGGHDPMVAAASTQRSRSPTPSGGKRGDKRGGNARPKSHPPSRPDFHSFQNPGNGMCKFHNYYANRANRCIPPCSLLENCRTHFGSAAFSTHATAMAMHFPAIAGLMFLTDELPVYKLLFIRQ